MYNIRVYIIYVLYNIYVYILYIYNLYIVTNIQIQHICMEYAHAMVCFVEFREQPEGKYSF